MAMFGPMTIVSDVSFILACAFKVLYVSSLFLFFLSHYIFSNSLLSWIICSYLHSPLSMFLPNSRPFPRYPYHQLILDLLLIAFRGHFSFISFIQFRTHHRGNYLNISLSFIVNPSAFLIDFPVLSISAILKGLPPSKFQSFTLPTVAIPFIAVRNLDIIISNLQA